MAATLSADAVSQLNALLSTAALGDAKILPYCSLRITNVKGDILYDHAVGEVPLQPGDDVAQSRKLSKNTDDDIFVIYSCAKLVTAVALMTLVEKGSVSLDDPEVIERYLPELTGRKILRGFEQGPAPRHPVLTDIPPEAERITLRMLLLHTIGLEYLIWNERYWEMVGGDFGKAEGVKLTNIFSLPLISDPGTEWHYGPSLEHIGILIERITNRDLHDYYTKEIYEPLGLKNTNFPETISPNDNSRVLPVYMRTGAHTFKENPVKLGPPDGDVFPANDVHIYNGGAGLLSTIADFNKLTTALLNNGTSPYTGVSILSPTTIRQFTAPQLPAGTPFLIASQTPLALSHDLRSRGNPAMNWSFAGAVQGEQRVLRDGRRGRSLGSYYWGGLANTDWWVDETAGITVELWTGVLPWADERWAEFAERVEGTIYEGLREV